MAQHVEDPVLSHLVDPYPDRDGVTWVVPLHLRARQAGPGHGHDTLRDPREVRGLIGYAGQFTGVDGDLTVAENLAVAAILHRVPHNESWRRAGGLIEEFALTAVARQRAGRLSGGCAAGSTWRALIRRPSVLFPGEPGTGLDPQSRAALRDRLRSLRDAGTTVFLTTRYPQEADRLCGRVAITDAGEFVAEGPPAELKAGIGMPGPTLDDVFLRYTGDRPRSGALQAGATSSVPAAAHGRGRRA